MTGATGGYGIIAYGSLVQDPGPEIAPLIVDRIDVVTPFRVEFARLSASRGGAPTLVPVTEGGAEVPAVLLRLNTDVDLATAQTLLWRRERWKFGVARYIATATPSANTVIVDLVGDMPGVAAALYTRIGANAAELTGAQLAAHAIASVKATRNTGAGDGITYLIDAKARGLITPKLPAYEAAILEQTGAASLEDARARAAGRSGVS